MATHRAGPSRTASSAYSLIFIDILDGAGRLRTSIWRRGGDSNPRYGCPYAAFRVRCFQPLNHLSKPLRGLRFSVLSGVAEDPVCYRIATERPLTDGSLALFAGH